MASNMLFRGLAAVAAVMSMTVGSVQALGTTDVITWGGQNMRNGYFPNNNMDPSIVTSDAFGQVFKVNLPGNYGGQKERIFSQPLIYTPKGGDGTQYVYWATAQNNVYKMNAKTGEIIASRNLHIPFMSQDLNAPGQTTPGYCQDINPTVGIIGTGVIDPDTDTLYLTAKTYQNQEILNVPQGRPAGRVFIHALNVNDLTERPNFPINLEGMSARNNPLRTFNGGIQNQRPALLQPKGSDFIYAGFGSHCVLYNFTGWVVGWHKTTGQIVERFATQGEGISNEKKGAGLWMSGGGIASDDRGSIFFATGNGYAEQVKDLPINRGSIPTSLEEAVVHMTYDAASGALSPVDFFMPANKGYLDGGDLDLGTSPLVMLPSDPFSCGSIRRIGVITGKDRWTYFLNLDDLGGYRNGPDLGNRVLGSFYNENSVYAGAGVWPFDGGYVYINVNGFRTNVFKFNCVNGVPAFSKVANSSPQGNNGFGVGHGATTSLNGQPGTGLFWVVDPNNNNPERYSLRIYEVVPTGDEGRLLRLLKGFPVPAINKFSRPQFGDGMVYVGSNDGSVYGFGAPTDPALNCTALGDFGVVNLGNTGIEQTITCTSKVALSVTNITLESSHFTMTGLPTLPRQMGLQTSFTFKANFKPGRVGAISGTIVIKTQNNGGRFATSSSVRLSGTGESQSALLTVEPADVTFNLAVVGSEVISNSVLFTNEGKTGLTVESIQFSESSPTGPFVDAVTSGSQTKVGHFTFNNLPATLDALEKELVDISFNPAVIGNYTLFVSVKTDGGSRVLTLRASVGASPIALIQLEKPDGTGWQTWNSSSPALSFGKVLQNSARALRFRISNIAPAGSVPLQIPISKPPFGVPGLIISTANQVDLGEGSNIPAGEYQEAVITCTVPKSNWNSDPYTNGTAWVFNTNDLHYGKFEVPFTCTAVTQQAAPLKSNGDGVYRYLGCFRENNPGRQLKELLYGSNNNTAANCLAACAAKGYPYCGTQYHRECWGGPSPPIQQVAENGCNFDCTGDSTQWCGGNGVGENLGKSHLTMWATNTTLLPPSSGGGPVVNPGLNGYRSIGCYTEATTGRALPNMVSTNNIRTVAACINACGKLNYKYIGLEYGGECWCGNAFGVGANSTLISQCGMTCRENNTEYCGGSQRLNVYQLDTSTGTSTTSLSTSTSTTSTSTSTSTTAVTTSTTATLSTTTSSTTTTSATTTSTTSTSASTSTTATSESTSTSTTSTGLPTPTAPSSPPTVGAFRYDGCWSETTQGGRALNGLEYYNDTMTLEACANACKGFSLFAAEYGRECFCGNEIRGDAAVAEDQATCDVTCPGNKWNWCGGRNRFSLYRYDAALENPAGETGTTSATGTTASTSSTSSSAAATTTSTSLSTTVSSTTSSTSTSTSTSTTASTSTSTTTTTTSAQPTVSAPLWPGNANFTYYHCVSEPSSGRLFTRQVLNDAAMTHDRCLEACWQFNYAGIEYGRECWCGDVVNWAGNSGATPGANVTEADCKINCPGDTKTKCGGSKRMSLFQKKPEKFVKKE
ncbi:WSC domain-containing protein [Stachybotrys elegans]|uniref:WSC domain-containing protein n=1 Tax=Stachybotrys elegans TaxID=80388 RepID=A0A8K0WL43_9HYPO|nr:WSC domain-containing protein [Stachybotrys elegans]